MKFVAPGVSSEGKYADPIRFSQQALTTTAAARAPRYAPIVHIAQLIDEVALAPNPEIPPLGALLEQAEAKATAAVKAAKRAAGLELQKRADQIFV